MAALPQILLMLVPLGVLLLLRPRLASARGQRAILVGFVLVWGYAAYQAIALTSFLLLTPGGIGQDNWPELWVSLAVVLALPVWAILRAGSPRDS